MATQGEINQHDSLIERFSRRFAVGLAPLLTALYDNLASEENPDRLTVTRYFLPIRQYAQAQLENLEAVLADNAEMNKAVLEGVVIDTSRIRAEAIASINASIDEEANNLIGVLATSALVGGVTAATITALRKSRKAVTRRLQIAYSTNLRNGDAAYTILATRATNKTVKYRYVGGIIPESRPFCRQHDGQVMTESEIRRIWNSQTWQGKKPGDPFVVRGGYNCRHYFVPVEEE